MSTGPTECPFCGIIADRKILLGENPSAVAFADKSPASAVHVLIVTRTHHVDPATVSGAEWAEIMDLVLEQAWENGLTGKGYKVKINVGKAGGQTVPHMHIHLQSGR
jgi:histidine triad (HIT) family protein